MRRSAVSPLAILVPTALFVLTAAPAAAHGGAGADLAAGIVHPFSGADHLVAMLAVGLWAGLAGGAARLVLPLAFPVFMAAGAALAWNGGAIPALESLVALSVVALGLIVACAHALRLPAALGLVAVFALVHGFAHGLESPASAQASTYAAGFVLATFALHLAGLALGWFIGATKRAPLSRIGGAAIAVAGALMLAS